MHAHTCIYIYVYIRTCIHTHTHTHNHPHTLTPSKDKTELTTSNFLWIFGFLLCVFRGVDVVTPRPGTGAMEGDLGALPPDSALTVHLWDAQCVPQLRTHTLKEIRCSAGRKFVAALGGMARHLLLEACTVWR